jgi:signal recognition particle receptor subunit beta
MSAKLAKFGYEGFRGPDCRARRKGETVDLEPDNAVMQGEDGRLPSIERPQQWRTPTIGRSLEQVRNQLSFLGDELAKHVDALAVPLLLEAQKQLKEITCRIAIVGQVKAGKSTFCNALVENPGLLPSDVNPSSVVVTSLNFRNSPTAPEHAAMFHFFSSEQWHDLARGEGNPRGPTERLAHPFKPNLLRTHLDFVRSRAERRLGDRFHEMLGKSHYCKEIDRQVLCDYIGGDEEEVATADRASFSDITRAADLYFSQGPFAFPVTLIDTPGNNDPFLVRDEITHRTLQGADVVVCILSALQPLSAADVGLLQLLSGLQTSKIVVFINRIDQLDDPAVDGSAVQSAVERRLRSEFPAIDIPVIIGSSWWGSIGALASDVDLNAHLTPDQVSALAKPLAHVPRVGDSLERVDRLRLSETLYQRSGMLQVAAALEASMSSSSTAILLRQAAACFLEIAKSTEIAAKVELRSIEQRLTARQLEIRNLGEKTAEEQESLRLFEERAGALRETFRQIETHFTELIDNGTEALQGELQRIVHEFSDQQAQQVTLSRPPGSPGRPQRCNVVPLRVRLETAYLSEFDKLAGDLLRIESFLYPQLKAIVANLVPDISGGYLEPPTEPMQALPSAPLSTTISLDLSERWWKHLFTTKPTPQEQADYLRQLIDTEFGVIITELARLAHLRLSERTDHTLKRLDAVASGLVTGIDMRKSLLAAECDRLATMGNEQAQQADGELIERKEACTAARTASTLVREQLMRLMQTLEASETRPGEGIIAAAGT